jgi:peptidoglycan/xylan/chitin deacetylase (PgdA/CDA1 family)
MLNDIAQVLDPDQKLACITLDFETDYGDRIGAFNIIDDRRALEGLSALFAELDVPVSAFIRTDLLLDYPRSGEVVRMVADDYHCHSHTHRSTGFDSRYEIAQTAAAFEECFGYRPSGYRAPYGRLYPGDIDLLKAHGFKFSASVFPSFRPGKFNHLSLPITPFAYDNGIVELPFAVVPGLRYIVSLSYLKLLGMSASRVLFSLFGLPDIVVFDSHLHDFIVNETSFRMLPPGPRLAWGRNKHAGNDYLRAFVGILRERGYRFITMTGLYEYVRERLE